MPKVSIIVPIYKVENYIGRCTRSILNQTLDNIELIFIDDCSPDHSMVILSHIIDEFRNKIKEKNWIVIIKRMQVNSGQAAVRQYGIQLATGEYIIFCDSDDWMEENMIFEMWSKASIDNLDVVVCDYNHITSNGCIRYCGMKSHDMVNFFYEVLFFKSSWAVWNKLFKRSLYYRIVLPENGMNMGEDMAIVVQLLYYCRNVGYINQAFYNYCENTESISNKKTISDNVCNYLQWFANICLLESFFKEKGIKKRVGNGLSFLVTFSTDDILFKLKSLTQRKYYLLIPYICMKVWCNSFISLYGKIQLWRYVNKNFFPSIKHKLQLQTDHYGNENIAY